MLVVATADIAGAIEARVIYRCKANGVTTFSDRPCGDSAQPYAADDSSVSSYAPGEPAAKSTSAARPKQRKIRQGRGVASDQAKLAAECEHVNAALRDIARKMRSGYGVKEGERLKEKKAQLEQKRRTKRCR